MIGGHYPCLNTAVIRLITVSTPMTIPTNITRPKGTNRYLFSIRINGKRINKSFPDADYGGQEKALAAAIEYKRKVYEENGLDEKGRGGNGPITGVSRTSSIRYGVERAYWQAVWTDHSGKPHTRRFSVTKLGERKAQQQAIAARNDALKALQDGEDPRFIQPVTKYTKLWRYMDFPKFLSLLDDSAIFFARADSFEDPYEGELPKGNVALRNFVKSKSSSTGDNLPQAADKKTVMISCWHMSTYESAAMWKLYGQANQAICITTKYAKLKNQLVKGAHIGLVRYVDHNRAWVPENNIYYPYMFKRKSFEHEKEVRALIDINLLDQEDLFLKTEHGFKNRVDLNTLIDEIYVDPSASEWFFQLVKSVVAKYNIKAPVKKSPLLLSPKGANNALH